MRNFRFKRYRQSGWFITAACLLALAAPLAAAQESEADEKAELAKKTQNPLADLISMPFQSNWDFNIGPRNATRYTLNIQPIVPISLNEDWLLVTRTIVPVIHAEAPVKAPDGMTPPETPNVFFKNKSGFGDILQSFFFARKQDSPEDLGWGVGPVLLWPTASKDQLGTGKFGAGPTAVVVIQRHGLTAGFLANHVWSYAGESDRDDVSFTSMQPFLTYTTKTYTTIGLTSETVYDWEGSDWVVPLNLTATQLLKIGPLPFQVGFGPRVYLHSPSGGPDWGLRLNVNFLLPGI